MAKRNGSAEFRLNFPRSDLPPFRRRHLYSRQHFHSPTRHGSLIAHSTTRSLAARVCLDIHSQCHPDSFLPPRPARRRRPRLHHVDVQHPPPRPHRRLRPLPRPPPSRLERVSRPLRLLLHKRLRKRMPLLNMNLLARCRSPRLHLVHLRSNRCLSQHLSQRQSVGLVRRSQKALSSCSPSLSFNPLRQSHLWFQMSTQHQIPRRLE